jgi:hypothetical protein
LYWTIASLSDKDMNDENEWLRALSLRRSTHQ